ncbi:MAG: hypothetical protein IPL79_08550 [Myxococcales bacterium]|nr:hypothetical protein [Myxococcales bacterium]
MAISIPDTGRPRRGVARWLLGGLAVAFGVATLVEGGGVLFGSAQARAAAGNVVPFVLWFNFAAGFIYIVGGLATLRRRPVAIWIARALAAATLVVFAAFAVHVLTGGAHEPRTVVAMTLRSAFWVAQALLLPRIGSLSAPK